jgi:hypothetical protein
VYGAGVGFFLNDEAPWNATAVGVGGLAFNITALTAGAEVRLVVEDGTGTYCKVLVAAGAQTVRFSDATFQCWEAGGSPLSPTGILYVDWHVMANAASTHDFAFCIEGLAVVP